MKKESFDNFYLVGGTALSLQLGHRQSIDLDLFSQKEFSFNLISKLEKNYKAINISDNSIEVSINGVKIFLLYFAFPRNRELKTIERIRLADPVDIGLMKLLALQGRTTKKDIIDLYIIHKKILPLDSLLNLFEKHFPKESFNSYRSTIKLIDREALEKTSMPKMLEDVEYQTALKTIEKYIFQHISKLINK